MKKNPPGIIQICLLYFLATIISSGCSENKTKSPVQTLSPEVTLERFRDLKYGAFIHWTPTTQIAREVSFSRNVFISPSAYDSLYLSFNPTEFNAEEWVKILKDAGFRYLVFVPKHHDGFSMWDTKLSNYNIMNSPFGRDVIKEIAIACKKYDLPLCLYYSIGDFYHPDCVPDATNMFGLNFGPPGYSLPAGQTPDYNRYVTFMKGQLKELTENYGPFLGWWFDGGWQRTWTTERGSDLYQYVRKLQPDVLMSHRVGGAYRDSIYLPTWFPDEKNRVGDYAVLEVDMPRFNRDIPWEYTYPANGKSYSWTKNEYRDISFWVDDLVKSACGDGNFILGVSAPPTGRWEPKLLHKFSQMNAWLKQYGESVFDTRGGPYKRNTLYGSTCKDNKIYLHIFKDTTITLRPLGRKIIKSRLLNGGKVTVKQSNLEISVSVNQYDFDRPTTIVELELDGSAESITPIGELPINRNVKFSSSNTDQTNAALSADGNLETAWVADGKTEKAWLQYDFSKPQSISRAILFEGKEEGTANNIRSAEVQALTDSGWHTIKKIAAWGNGSPKFDEWPISVSLPEIRFQPVNARAVRIQITRANGIPTIHEFDVYNY